MIIEDVHCGRLTPSQNGDYIFRDSRVDGINGQNSDAVEIDKVIQNCLFLRSDIDGPITNATSVMNLRVIDCTVRGGEGTRNPLSVTSRNVFVSGCRLFQGKGAAFGMLGPSSFPVHSMSVQDTLFVQTNASATDTYGFSRPEPEEVVVSSVTGTDILFSDDATGREVARRIDIGQFLWNKDTGKGGRILNLIEEFPNFRISGEWDETPSAGETWQYYTSEGVNDLGGNRLEGVNAGRRRLKRRVWMGEPEKVVTDVVRSDEGIINTFPCWGFIENIAIRVLEAGTGSTPQLTVRVKQADGVSVDDVLFDLAQTGYREVGIKNTSTPATNDTLNTSAIDRWTPDIQIFESGVSVAGLYEVSMTVRGPY